MTKGSSGIEITDFDIYVFTFFLELKLKFMS